MEKIYLIQSGKILIDKNMLKYLKYIKSGG